MKPGDVVVGILVGAHETKVRPAVVIASATYLTERPDAVVGILTTKLPKVPGTTDYVLQDWQSAGLRVESCFRAYGLDGPSLGIDADRPPQRPRLGVGEGTGSYGLRPLMAPNGAPVTRG